MMEDKNLRVPGHPARPSSSQATQATKRETRGDYDGRQEMPISRDHPHHHPAPMLQEGRQEEIMMGDKNLRVPVTPGTTIPFQTSKTGGKRRL